MNTLKTLTLSAFAIILAPALHAAPWIKPTTMAHADMSDKVVTGEAGYTIGCSIAAQFGAPSCGELASGRQFMKPEAPQQGAPQQETPQQETPQLESGGGD